MRKDSALIFGLSTAIAVGIVAGVYYLNEAQSVQQIPAQVPEFASRMNEGGAGAPTTMYSNGPTWTDTPIKCVDPEIGEFWTNARDCASADLDNRISIAEPLATPLSRQRHTGVGYQSPAEVAKSARHRRSTAYKPSLPLIGKSPPSGLNAGCTFVVGRALEVERPLSAADNPKESTWRENYCRWRCEAIEKNCEVSDSYYYYRFSDLCRQEYWYGCSVTSHNRRRGQG